MHAHTQRPEHLGGSGAQLDLHIVARRAWCLSKHSTPPESLADLLADYDAKMARAAEQLQSAHAQTLLLERAATQSDEANILRESIISLDSDVARHF